MKKILQILLIFIASINLFGQLDREHWFAPMYDGQSNKSGYEQFLHLSTNETTPFTVYIYTNNNLIEQRTISKGSPAVVEIPRHYIITDDDSYELNKVMTKGLYVKGDRPLFANLRFGVTNHSEIITSKGTAGIGTEFYTVMAPSAFNSFILGASASFLATEDNTTVNVGNFKNKNIDFNTYGYSTGFTFKLNRGESYILDVRATNLDNRDGFIGAKVTSDKPISMSNGNFNGQYASPTAVGSDILMDQSVPVDKLGDEFVIVKGYGAIGNNMEGAIIVATQKNTSIYLNDDTTPIKILAEEGDYYRVEETSYIDRGNRHYNLHIKTDKNVYVYQLLGGVEAGASPLATGGMNYIPPLNCYLPRKIDEISYINKIQPTDPNNRFVTKLNIITEKGAVIKVNDVVPASIYGPYDISNIATNQQWVTYSIPNVTGNITVVSNKAVTAGIASGNGAFGYGGYFAGFSSIPLILKTEGECLPGVKLEVTEGFDVYQWLIKDASGNYIPAPGTNNTYSYVPPQAGIYSVKIQQGSCPQIQTQDFKFYNCTTYTNVDYETCSTIEEITPVFSLSTQAINPPTVVITEPAKKGIAEVLSNGKIKYTANRGESGIDTFKYYYCGAGAIPDCETAQASIQINQVVGKDTVLRECTSSNIVVYDLRKADVTADTTVSKVYYKTLTGAENEITADVINNFTAFPSPDTNVYVRIKNLKNCVAVQKIELKSKAYPIVQENLYTRKHCDEEDNKIDGNYIVNPNDITPFVLNNSASFSVKYYDSKTKAETGGTDNIIGNYVFSVATAKIWIRAESADNCVTIKEIPLQIGSKITLITKNLSVEECDSDYDDKEAVTLDKYIPQLTSATSPSAKYYASLEDAEQNLNEISATQIINAAAESTFYYVIKNAQFCADIAAVKISLKKGFPSTTLQAVTTICDTSTVELNAGSAHIAYKWFNENNPSQVIPSTQKVNLGPGKYYVILTSPNLCEYKQNFEIIGSPKAILDISKFNATFCDDKLKGQIDVKFSTQVTPVILQNPHPDIKVEYYRDAAFTQLINGDNFSYSADTRVYVKAVSKYCTETRAFIDFKIGNKVVLSSIKQTQEVCDDDLDGRFKVSNLNDYIKLFTSDPNVSANFYVRESDAKIEAANNITEIDVNNQQVLYVRFYNTTGSDCPNIGELTIKIKIPKKSDVLADRTICPDDKTDVEAALAFSDFQSYNWYSDNDPSTIIATGHIARDLPVGKYFVILTGNYPNDCPFRQDFEIKAAELPVIDGIEISGSTVRIIASGGAKPYRYAIDGGAYQDSNVFTDLDPGLHTAYVISADNCEPVEKEFSVIKIYNLITPNGDGVNDVLDMSLLKLKINVKFQIFDREGKKLFEGNNNNNYIWDGRQNGKPLSSSSYWYVMEWQDFENAPPVKYTGWILLKNRNSD